MNEQDFEDGFIELIKGAISEKEKQRYRNSNILYWKALMQLCDLTYWKDKGKPPKNLAIRLEYFRERNNRIMQTLGENEFETGKPYAIYQDTYKSKQDEKIVR